MTPSQLALAHQRMAPQLHLALELQPGEGPQEAHLLLDRRTTHLHQVEHTTIFQLHTVVHRLQQRQLQHQGTETKQQHQQPPTAQTANHHETIGLTHLHQDTMLPHQLQTHRHLLHMEVVMMRRRRLLGLETDLGTLTATKSKMKSTSRNLTLIPSIASFVAT